MPTPEPKRRWFHLSPDRFVGGLLLAVCLLWLSDRFQWFGFNHHKGWTVLIAVAAVGTAAVVMLLRWIVSLIFRWRFQFGIRSLLAFCLASSIAAGWLAIEIKQARRQVESVEWIKSSDGAVLYDWQVDADGTPIGNSEPLEPRWLRKMLGDDFFSAVVWVFQVRRLATEITDAGLEYLTELTQLRRLDLNRTKITDAGLEQLTGLTQLSVLYLYDTQITDAGLEHLTALTQLRVVGLGGAGITDAGLDHLKGLNNLQTLSLYLMKMTDARLEHLTAFTQLQVLGLGGKGITDSGLKHLKGMSQLRELNLSGTDVTDAGVEKLQRALPNCRIIH